MRILHLPVGSGHQAWGLSRAERQLGQDSDVVIFEQNQYLMQSDRVLFEAEDTGLTRELKRWAFFLKAIWQYDVFHFHFGQKFFNLFPRPTKRGDSPKQAVLRLIYWCYSQPVQHLDVIVLKLLGKRLFATFHGDDLRQGDRSRSRYKYSIAQEVGLDYYDDYSDERKRRTLKYYRRFCNEIYVVSPDLLDMADFSLKWIGYTGVDYRQITPSPYIDPTSRPLKIVHAPTHRLAKGTRFIEDALDSLRAEGFEFELCLIENVSHAEAMKMYEQADLVIDQLLAGWFGVFALEIMAMGKPVVCYLRPEAIEKTTYDYQEQLPIINANPSDLADVLRALFKKPHSLHEIGLRSRRFAEKYHDPIRIAKTVLVDYESAQ